MDNYDKFSQYKENLNNKNESRHQNISKEIFTKYINKAIMTVGVNDISTMEENFGFLWGQGKPLQQLTINEQEWRKLWEGIRRDVFDKINERIRKVHMEANKYKFNYVGYHYNLDFRSKENG